MHIHIFTRQQKDILQNQHLNRLQKGRQHRGGNQRRKHQRKKQRVLFPWSRLWWKGAERKMRSHPWITVMVSRNNGKCYSRSILQEIPWLRIPPCVMVLSAMGLRIGGLWVFADYTQNQNAKQMRPRSLRANAVFYTCKMLPFYKCEIKIKRPFFFLLTCIWGANSYILPNF